MLAQVTLKRMPKHCFDCPFLGDVCWDEVECEILNYNNVKYELYTKKDVTKVRRDECPLVFVER